MSDANFPNGPGIVTEGAAGLEANDFGFIGYRPSDSNPAKTIYSELKAAILASVSSATDVAVFWDEKPSGSRGGTFTSGAWRIRDINNLTCPSGFCSLSSNQLTLNAGKYLFIALCPAALVNNHKAGLYNVSLSSFSILGTTAFASSTGSIQNYSHIIGYIDIASQQIFEVRHQCILTSVDSGFGTLAAFAENGIYTTGSIIKL